MEPPASSVPSISNSDRFQAILGPLQPAFDELEAFLSGQVMSFEPEVQPLVEYCFGHSGKKLRPILVFSTAMDSADEFPRESVIKAAAIVELVHLATLVHDDILDEADIRHRTETVVSRYGAHIAVLLGDALFSHALHLAATFPDVEVCRAVSMATRQVCSGEIAQTFSRGGEAPSLSAYYRMIDLKTAELFAVSAYLGSFLSGLPETTSESASQFARHLGIAYQIYDDAADIFGRESQAGKTLGTDLATGKLTLPVLVWLESLPEDERSSALKSLQESAAKGADQASLLGEGVLEMVEAAFREQLNLAKTMAGKIPGEYRKGVLLNLIDFVESAWNKFSIR
ncbi:polyprenyl synthetase family protein [Puniceicoccales bacterium CK1056]|uniref:Polyprenyl synthetase family protein n=1 Tax=Oceanipulchritudo coccoides TaxID=2706888 RepID=A0A6B2LZH3_9BACT|nr:polyprenyl synthetase family protein [Oceanipulchritudo coccoides]NDV61344.1 polyprenyl synthetase family protein [Oceanipulchritudo coccoides]